MLRITQCLKAKNLATLLLLVVSFSGAALAQTEAGQINGKVLTSQGAMIAGAAVTAKSVDTGAVRTVTSNERGLYSFPYLQPGLYEITAQTAGFAPVTQRARATVGSRTAVEIVLSTAIAEGVIADVITGGAAEVNTQNQELSDVVSGAQLRGLPTLTRNPYDLVSLSGNVAADAGGSTNRGVGVAINGQRAANVNVMLDGGENVDYFGARVGQSVPLDAVQEFRVLTSSFSAEYGRASGGIVNVGTRAGSNEFHGSAYEFNRLSHLAANGFENNANRLARGVFARNQFGYAVGGPVVRDRFFFFNSTEWTRVRSSGNAVSLVPTPELIAAASPATRQFFGAYRLGTPINGMTQPVKRVLETINFDPQADPQNAFAALPPDLPAFGLVSYPMPRDLGGGLPQNSYQTVTRLDWNVSDRTQIYGRYAVEGQDFFAGTIGYSPYQGFNTGASTFNQNLLISATHSWRSRLISQTKLVYNRLNYLQPLGEQPFGPTLYFFPQTDARLWNYQAALPGYLPFTPGHSLPFGGPQNLNQLQHDVNWTGGRHQFQFGGQYVYLQDNRAFAAYQWAKESLSAQGNFAQALDHLVRGQLHLFEGAVDPQGKFPGETVQLPVSMPPFNRSNRYHDFALYAQDSWRVHPGVTLNLGLRYEYYGVQHNNDRRLDANFYLGPGATPFERIRQGRVSPASASPVGGLYRPDKNNFAPRLGFAVDLFGDGRTSVRGGYGLAFERSTGRATFNLLQNPPAYAVVSLTAGTDVASLPIAPAGSGPLGGGSGTAVLPPTSVYQVRADLATAYAHLFSLAFEHEILPRTVVAIEYSGSRGQGLYSLEDINRAGTGLVYLGSAAPAPGGRMTTRLNGQYTGIRTLGNQGFSRHNALTFSAESNDLRDLGLQFTARYTYAMSKDNLSSTFSESANNFNLGLLDPFDPRLDYGLADFDTRHRFVASVMWEIPYARRASGWLRHLLDGWSLAGIATARTGTPFTVYDCRHAITTCNRLVPTGPVSYTGPGSPQAAPGAANRFVFIDLSNQKSGAYVNPITGTSEVGPFPADMIGRNAFRGPGAWNLDGGLYKRLALGERYSLQFRAEFFNVFNHANLYVRGEEADVSSFSYVPAFRDGRRNVQLALRFGF